MQTYPDAKIALTDTIESANQKIVANSKIYQDKIRVPSTSSGGSSGGTEGERQSNAYATINQILALPKEQGFVDANGYITSQGFKDIVNSAREDNISRSEFLEQYAYLLYPQGGKAYGLTSKEMEDYGITAQ